MENHCRSCNKSFNTKYYLTEHIKIIHDKILSHQCSQCSKSFGRKYELRDHINFVHNKMKFDCQECSSIFQNARNLKAHIKKKHPNAVLDDSIITPRIRDKRYDCDKCPTSFDKRSQRTIHVKSKHQKNAQKVKRQLKPTLTTKTPLNCETCDLRFKSSKIFQRHQRICLIENQQRNQLEINDAQNEPSFQMTCQIPPRIAEWKMEPDVIVEIPLNESGDIDNLIKSEVNQNISEAADIPEALESPLDEEGNEPESDLDTSPDDFRANIPTIEAPANDPDIIKESSKTPDNDPDVIVESIKNEKKSFVCNPCNKPFETELELGVHIGMTHSVTFLKCPKCMNLFSNQHNFVLHLCK